MVGLSDDQRRQFCAAVEDASRRRDVAAAMDQIYADLAVQIDERRPICRTSGRCCRFDDFGHNLFVTTAEMGVFISRLRAVEAPLDVESAPQPTHRRISLRAVSGPSGDSCQFQRHGLCSVHEIRPFGCRVFFCDATAQTWQAERYELFHGRLRGVHQRLQIPYFYIEWRQALKALGGLVNDPESL